MLRHEFGGNEHFVCFAYENESETFLLKPIQGQRHRIETELDNDGDEDDCLEVFKKHMILGLFTRCGKYF